VSSLAECLESDISAASIAPFRRFVPLASAVVLRRFRPPCGMPWARLGAHYVRWRCTQRQRWVSGV